jgi:hypothetical protein
VYNVYLISRRIQRTVTGDWRKLRNELFVLHTKYYLGDQIKDDEMGWTCGMYGREETCIEFGGETRRKEDTWKNLA